MAIFEGERLEEARRSSRGTRKDERSAVMPLLYLAQSVDGHVTRGALQEVASLIGVRTAEVEAVASFYDAAAAPDRHPSDRGLHEPVLRAAGASEVYEAAHRATGIPHGGEVSDDGDFTVHEEECLGVCEHARRAGERREPRPRRMERVTEIVAALRGGEVPEPARGPAVDSFKTASRILAGLEPLDETLAEGANA